MGWSNAMKLPEALVLMAAIVGGVVLVALGHGEVVMFLVVIAALVMLA